MGILHARILKWGCHALLQGIFLTQGLNPSLPHCRQILYQLSYKGSPRTLESVAYSLSSRSSRPRNRTGSPVLPDSFTKLGGIMLSEISQRRGRQIVNDQCMKGKSEGEVVQLYPTVHNPIDCSLPGSSVHGIFQARVLEYSSFPDKLL